MKSRQQKRTRKKTRRLLAIDLFSGCGGLTLGLKRAGFEVIAAVENDKLSYESFEQNHRATRLWKEDIRDISILSMKRVLRLRKGKLDLLAGCPPCQGFSTLVTNNGSYRVDDPRNALIYEFLRFVREFMPRAVMLENVPDLANTTRFKRFRKRLEKLGYQTKFEVLDAADYGVPQRRKRLVLLACRDDLIRFARKAKKKLTVRDAFEKLGAKRAKNDPLHATKSNRTDRIKQLIRSIPKNGGSRTDLRKSKQLQCHAEFDGFYDVYGRMKWNEPSPTITSGCINPSKGRFLHPKRDRAISLREAALLQSFPVSYKFSLANGKYKTATLIGNAFPPEFARRHALMVKRKLTTSVQ